MISFNLGVFDMFAWHATSPVHAAQNAQPVRRLLPRLLELFTFIAFYICWQILCFYIIPFPVPL
jgi:hypothetical protein